MNLINGHWIEVTDGDPRAVGIYRRHYSCSNPKHDHVRYGFSGEGESMVLLTVTCDALFGWRKQKYSDDGQDGVNCFVFRNEGNLLSSDLIKEADELAWQEWPGERLYTYIDPRKIRSTNPGYCFLQAGWKRLEQRSKQHKLAILEIRQEVK